MADPIRSKLLYAIGDQVFSLADEPGATIRQLADRLGEPKRRVRYHVGKLVDQDLIVVAGEKVSRGTMEKCYRVREPGILFDEQSGDLSAEQARQVALNILQAFIGDATAAIAGKKLGMRPGHAELRLPGKVDQQGWKELAVIHEQALGDIQGVVEGSQRRLKDAGEVPIPFVSGIFLFEVPPRY